MIHAIGAPVILAVIFIVLFLLTGMAYEAQNDRVATVTGFLGLLSLIGYTYLIV